MDVAARLRQIIDHYGITINGFAVKIGVSQPRMVNYFKGRQPDLETINKIVITFVDINPRWLITGEGEMIQPDLTENNVNIEYLREKDLEISALHKENSILLERAVRAEALLESANSQILHLECRTRSIASDVTAPYNADDTFNYNK